MECHPSVLALRHYLQETSKEELSRDWVAVRRLGLKGPTLTELLQGQRARATYLPLFTKHYDA